MDGNVLLISKDQAEKAMDAASCIGCGACVAACKNASPALFVGAKVSHLALLPQGAPERTRRVRAILEAVDREGFGSCSNQNECEAVCPNRISVRFIAILNREYLRAGVVESGLPAEPEAPCRVRLGACPTLTFLLRQRMHRHLRRFRPRKILNVFQ